MTFHAPYDKRVTYGQLASSDSDGNNGAFYLDARISSRSIWCIASDGEGWEHVSVSVRQGGKVRTPVWEEMSYVKSVFWDDEDVCMQLHPARSNWVNNHENVLHIWRPIGVDIPLPDSMMVGNKDYSQADIEQMVKAGMSYTQIQKIIRGEK